MKRIIGLYIFISLAFPLASMAGEPATSFSGDCQCPGKKGYQRTATWADCVELCRDKSGGSSSGGSTSAGDLGTALGTFLGNAIVNSLKGDPEAAARRNAEAAAQAARAAEESRAAEEARRTAEEERLRLEDEMKNRLLGNMLNVSDAPQLGLMGTGSGVGLSLMTDSAPPDKGAEKAKSAAYSKGFEHASQCISQNSGSACVGVAADQQQSCVADYRNGYDLGSKQRAVVLQEAYQAGHSAAAQDELANGASDPRALGPCRTDWIMAYNNGYGVKAPSVPGKIKATKAAVDTRNPEVTRVINEMNALAKKLGWSADEQARLAQALNSLDVDGDPNVTGAQIQRAWQDVLAREQGGDIAQKAAQGDGPGFPGAGKQTRYEDCAIFALANAAGLPYGTVAARASKLIGEGEWRNAAERANPQKVIEQKGLIGGEVVMLAEAFGQAEVVPSSAFAKTLKEGRPVMVNVVPENGNVRDGHEVVLTKTFQHGGETWYEMMDSNQGPQRRLYLSTKELKTMLQENGVAFRPETGTTPKLLR